MAADPHLITFHETTYWVEGKYPTQEEVQRLFRFSKGEYERQVAEIIPPLKNRGLPTEYLEKQIGTTTPVKKAAPKGVLDPLFVLAVNFVVDNVDKRSTAAKLKAAGVSTGQWKAFLNKPEYRVYFEKRLNSSFQKDVEDSAKLSLSRNVEAGDLQSIRYYHEYTGKYRPDQGFSMNMGILIGRFMEILSAHLDSEALNKVADDFEQAVIEASTRELTA